MAINYVLSDQLVAELVSDYNIQSSDFIGRVPMWIMNALGELGIYQAKIEVRKADTFGIIYDGDIFTTGVIEFQTEVVSGFQLPFNCASIDKLKLNGVIAHKKEKVQFEAKPIIVYKPLRIANDPADYKKDHIDLFMSLYNKAVIVENSVGYEYAVNGNFVHTNIESGTYELWYSSIPTKIVDGIEYPYIMDNGLLKRALKAYILKMMLMRGYVHPQLNLQVNNPFINPAQDFEQLRHRVRVSCNKYDVDERHNLTNPLNSF